MWIVLTLTEVHTNLKDSSPVHVFSMWPVFSAPSTAPANFNVLHRKSSSFLLGWPPITSITALNGQFVTYLVQCTMDGRIVFTANTTQPYVQINQLHFDTTYRILVAVVSTGGIGSYSSAFTAKTLQDGESQLSAHHLVLQIMCVTKQTSTICGDRDNCLGSM